MEAFLEEDRMMDAQEVVLASLPEAVRFYKKIGFYSDVGTRMRMALR